MALENIKCPFCGFDCPKGSRFCKKCGKSLIKKCPICNKETYVWHENCANCKKSFTEIEERIKSAEQKRGGKKELIYKFDALDKEGIISREHLDADEFIMKKRDVNGIEFPNKKEKEPINSGCLWLTNKRIVYLGMMWQHGGVWDKYNFIVPLNEIIKADEISEKLLFVINIPKLQISTKSGETVNFYCKNPKVYLVRPYETTYVKK